MTSPISAFSSTEKNYQEMREEVLHTLSQHDVDVWFPRCLDIIGGGFTAGYSNSWQPLTKQYKGGVFQSRLTWFAGRIAEEQGTFASSPFHNYARHGLCFLRDKLWDIRDGGFFSDLTREGELPRGHSGEKHVYGISFAIYACTHAARVLEDESALDLARKAFHWLETHAHDAFNGGYHESLTREGVPILAPRHASSLDQVGTPYGQKSSNTHVHLLESFAAIYRVWPDPLLRTRLEEVFCLVRDRMLTASGSLPQFFTSDFQPTSVLTSYGHNVEAAYLLIEGAGSLGIPDDPATWQTARALVDHALAHGLDEHLGGFFHQGPLAGPATDLRKIWWVQAEALNAFLLMHERFGAEDLRYWDAFLRTWQFIQQYQIDPEYGGWHSVTQPDGIPQPGPKGDNWKDPYHSGRALLNIAEALQRLAVAAENPS